MKLPVILVNFKLYESATGDNALALAKVHERVAMETGASIGVCVNPLDLEKVARGVSIPVFAQHVDDVVHGSFTGRILPSLVKAHGAFGTLLNHAEWKIDNELLARSIARCKEAGLFTLVCAESSERAEQIMKFEPDMVAVEPPALIGGDVSVSKAEPEIIENCIRIVGARKLLVGAGVKTGEDVKIALQLGASGVLLASGITKAEDPYVVLMDLVSGLGL